MVTLTREEGERDARQQEGAQLARRRLDQLLVAVRDVQTAGHTCRSQTCATEFEGKCP